MKEEQQLTSTYRVLMREPDEDGMRHKGIVFETENKSGTGGANPQQRASRRDSWFRRGRMQDVGRYGYL